MTTLTVTDAKKKFLGLVRQSNDIGEAYSVTHNGRPYAVIMGQEDYDGLLETVEILQKKAFSRELFSRLKEADAGKTVSFEKVVGRKQRL